MHSLTSEKPFSRIPHCSIPAGHAVPKHRLSPRIPHVLPKASRAVYPLMRSIDGFQDVIRPWASMVKTPSAMESMILLKKR